jgi:hypothetical protein
MSFPALKSRARDPAPPLGMGLAAGLRERAITEDAMDMGRVVARFGVVAVLVALLNVGIVIGIGWFIWKLVAMATGH